MNKLKTLFLILALSPVLCLKSNAQNLENGMDTISYCVGMMVGNSVKKQVQEVNVETFMRAFQAVMNDEERLFTDQEAQVFMQAYGDALKRKEYESKLAEEKAFLDANAQREEVTVLENGLQYEVLTAGAEDGAKPTASSRVKVHYHGTLVNGEVFDSSVDRGTPMTFGVNQVIRGWTEILQLMPVGSKWKVYIPYNLAYGERAAGKIQPYSALIFDIELIEIVN